jgi:hypothetical protein
VFLERNGREVDRDDRTIEIPKFGGGDRAWNSIVTCVKQQFSPFQIDVVETRPSRGDFITAVIGGRASQLGLDDRSTNGVGPYDGRVIPNAMVYIFSKVGTGERDTQNLCAVTVHEVSHALGLDHTYKCGDVMSYFLDRCGPRHFVDANVPCGEDHARTCGNGEGNQNSYRQVAAAVGLRRPEADPQPEPEPDVAPPQSDPWDAGDTADEPGAPADPYADEDLADEPATPPQRSTAPPRTQPQYQPPACGSHIQRERPNARRRIIVRRVR